MNTNDREPNADLVRLTESFCGGQLSGEEWARLERQLLADPEARAYFRRHASLDAALRDYRQSAAESWHSNVSSASSPSQALVQPARRTSRFALWAAAAASAALCVCAAWLLLGRTSEGRVIASLEEVTGDVRVLDASGQVRPIVADAAQIRSGDTVRTSGSRSATVVACADGTRLTLVGNTSVTCGQSSGMSFVIHHGTLAAAVQPQPRKLPLVLATPTAQVEVLGTRLLIEAGQRRTDLNVTEGRVRLVRVKDGETIEVAGGKRAVVTDQEQLLVEDIPRLADAWEVDFEDGLPAGWEIGEHTAQNLPPHSRGAVRAARHEGDDGETYHSIVSGSAWSQGLFAVGKNSHLHVTMKMDNPQWLNLFLITRTADPQNPRFCSNFIFKAFPKLLPGRWQTISIPLASFRKLSAGPETLEQVVPYHVIFNSTGPDRGLVIDRIWVTPDGTGEVSLQDAE